MTRIVFDYPLAIPLGILLALLLLLWMLIRQKKHPLAKGRFFALMVLRTLSLLILTFLAARPVWVEDSDVIKKKNAVILLVDKSQSMSLEEDRQTRYARAIQTARTLIPAFKDADIHLEPWLFGEGAETADGPALVDGLPNDKKTNLGGAIAHSLAHSSTPPLAIIALTDGAANEKADNKRALSALVESHVPFIGIGFGSDTGTRTLTLQRVEAPPLAAPGTEFNVTAHLAIMNVEQLSAFDLVLLRDGEMVQKKTVASTSGSRFWLENFKVKESKEGSHVFEVQLSPPQDPALTVLASSGSSSIRIANERELRVLYVQGALTWDYKFIGLALRGDPTIKVTGLTRTSSKSIFRQNVENAGELLNGFPSTLEEIAPFRVIVLSNLHPSDLNPGQQELLAKFCGELGGGVLMIGGPEAFDSSWHKSRLEELLPVVISPNAGLQGLDRPFQLQFTEEAMQSPVFQIADTRETRTIWTKLPSFTQYALIEEAKPGAQVWALHQSDDGPKGRRILMASQRYGAGLSAILTVQNFWRWRMDKDSDPQYFDRFWRQFFRFLSESTRQDVAIHLADQELRPGLQVQISLEKQPNPKEIGTNGTTFTVQVENSEKKTVASQTLQLIARQPVDFSFLAAKAGLYSISVLNAIHQPVSSRVIEIRDVNIELQDSARNMENLRQWASVSDGFAIRSEDFSSGKALLNDMKAAIHKAAKTSQLRKPAGINVWVFLLLMTLVSAEWMLRRRWSLP